MTVAVEQPSQLTRTQSGKADVQRIGRHNSPGKCLEGEMNGGELSGGEMFGDFPGGGESGNRPGKYRDPRAGLKVSAYSGCDLRHPG